MDRESGSGRFKVKALRSTAFGIKGLGIIGLRFRAPRSGAPRFGALRFGAAVAAGAMAAAMVLLPTTAAQASTRDSAAAPAAAARAHAVASTGAVAVPKGTSTATGGDITASFGGVPSRLAVGGSFTVTVTVRSTSPFEIEAADLYLGMWNMAQGGTSQTDGFTVTWKDPSTGIAAVPTEASPARSLARLNAEPTSSTTAFPIWIVAILIIIAGVVGLFLTHRKRD